MSLIKKNIWTLFYALLISSVLFTFAISFKAWKNTVLDYEIKQEHLVKIISEALHAQMISQEVLLNILGNQVIQNIENSEEIKNIPIFDNLLKNNPPSIPGLALLKPDGNFIYISSNADISKLPNLLEQEVSGPSFKHTLDNKHKMVLGRTYYFKPIKEWVIPIRKAFANEKGEVEAVLTSGLRLTVTSDLFNNSLHLGDYNHVEIIRDFDKYPLHVSAENADLKSRYTKKKFPMKSFRR